MNIIALVDPEAVTESDPQLEGNDDSQLQEMEFHVAEDLRLMGHKVRVVPFGPDIPEMIRILQSARPRLVFNLTEHFGGERRMDAYIAGLLDLLHLPYTGTGPEGLMLCRDKATCKRILSHYRMKVPDFASLRPGRMKLPASLKYPLIVKPVFEDGSDGISLASLVHNEEDMKERVRMIHESRKQPAICEEYVEGREIYVGILGNQRLQVLPPREVSFGHGEDGGPAFATARVKRDDEYRKKWKIDYRHAELTEAEQQKVGRVAKRIYRRLRIRDYGRIDMRLTPDGDVIFLEANPNPELTMGDELAESAAQAGISHEQLIGRIMTLALKRYRIR